MPTQRPMVGARQGEPGLELQDQHAEQQGCEDKADPRGNAPLDSHGFYLAPLKAMKIRSELAKILQHEDINFLLTNRIPRRLATRFLGWLSQIENPWVARASIAIWRLFADLDLSDAKAQTFKSLHA